MRSPQRGTRRWTQRRGCRSRRGWQRSHRCRRCRHDGGTCGKIAERSVRNRGCRIRSGSRAVGHDGGACSEIVGRSGVRQDVLFVFHARYCNAVARFPPPPAGNGRRKVDGDLGPLRPGSPYPCAGRIPSLRAPSPCLPGAAGGSPAGGLQYFHGAQASALIECRAKRNSGNAPRTDSKRRARPDLNPSKR